MSGLLRSRKRYLRRSSSFVLLFSSIGNGGVSASARVRRVLTRISISPVFRLVFTAPERASTTPVTAITNSLLRRVAFSKPASSISPFSKISCMIPVRSRRSTNIIPPLFLLFCTQPIRVTVSPILAVVTSVQRWVRFIPFIDSAISLPP